MHVLVGIHVVEAEPSRAKRLELRPDLLRELASNSRETKKPQAGARHVRIELAVRADQAGNLRRWQNRQAVNRNKMEPDP